MKIEYLASFINIIYFSGLICIEDREKLTVDEVAHYKDCNHLYYIEASTNLEVNVDVFVDKTAYYTGLEEEMPLSVWDSDWNETYIWASIEVTLPLTLTAVFNASRENVESFEVDVGAMYGWCRHCGTQIMSDSAETCTKCGKSFIR